MREIKSLFEFEGVVAHIKACIFVYFLVHIFLKGEHYGVMTWQNKSYFFTIYIGMGIFLSGLHAFFATSNLHQEHP